MRSQLVKFDLQLLHITGCIVISKDSICNCLLCCFLLVHFLTGLSLNGSCRFTIICYELGSVQQVYATVI